MVQDVGGVGTEAVLPTTELLQEQLQIAQEALDEPDPVVALASIDDAEQTFGQLEGELGDAGVVTDAAAVDAVDTVDTTVDTAGVQEGAAIATASITLEPGQYYTVIATQTQEALEGRINIGAQPGQAEINVTGPNGYAESFVGSRQLEALTPGNYIIAGTLVGYQSAQQQVQAQAGETLAADLVLEPLTQEQIAETPGGVTGGATGGAAGEAQAGAFPESPALVQLLVFQDSLDLPPAGQALVRVIHASPDAPAVNIIAEAQQEGEMTGAMTGGEVETGAMDVTFEPAGAVVTITGPDGFTQELTGSQTVEGLVPGEYVIAATLEGFEPSETRVEVAPGEVVPVDIILEATPQGSRPQGNALVNAFVPYTALLGLQLDQELEGYVSNALTNLDNDVDAAQQDLRAALLAIQGQLEGAEGDALAALQSTETTVQEALTALENDDAEGARQSLETLQVSQAGDATGGADVDAQTGGAETGGAVTGGADTGAQTGGAETGGTPADQAQVEGSRRKCARGARGGRRRGCPERTARGAPRGPKRYRDRRGQRVGGPPGNRSVRPRSADRARGGRPRECLGDVGGHTNGCRHNGQQQRTQRTPTLLPQAALPPSVRPSAGSGPREQPRNRGRERLHRRSGGYLPPPGPDGGRRQRRARYSRLGARGRRRLHLLRLWQHHARHPRHQRVR